MSILQHSLHEPGRRIEAKLVVCTDSRGGMCYDPNHIRWDHELGARLGIWTIHEETSLPFQEPLVSTWRRHAQYS